MLDIGFDPTHLIVLVVVGAFWFFVLYCVWQIARAFKNIEHSVARIAETLASRGSGPIA
jgi:hypothetical protein